MRTLLSVLLAFAMGTSQALAFEYGSDPVGKVYFSLQFGGPAGAKTTPRIGFRIDGGHGPSFTHSGAGAPASLVDWHLDFGGQTNLRLNGVDVGRLQRSLNAAEGEGLSTGQWVALGVGAVLLVPIIVIATRDCDFFGNNCNY